MSADRGKRVPSPPETPEIAVSLARAGWPVFPVTIYQDDAGKRHKVPAVKWKDWATTDEPTVVAAFSGEFSGCWIGVYAGKAGEHGIVVLDVDPGGDESLANAGLEIPATFNYPTHRAGGRHHVYAAPAGVELTIARDLYDSVDVRSGAGLMVYYGPKLRKAPKLAPAPDWLLVTREHTASAVSGDRDPSASEAEYRLLLSGGKPARIVRQALKTVKSKGMEYDDMLEAVAALVRLGTDGYAGVGTALDRARATYAEGWPDAGRHWDNAVKGSVHHFGLPRRATFAMSKAEKRARLERDAEPTPLPISDGAAVLDEARAQIRRFVALPSYYHEVAVTLWAVHTHLINCFDSSPRLAFLSPDPGSGKTRSLEVLAKLVHDPVETMNTTTAFLARRIDIGDRPPSILFDEVDTVFGVRARDSAAEEIRGILNSGHRRSGKYSRAAPRGQEIVLEEFSTFAPVAMAGLGDLPDTIRTRAVVVPMQRRRRDEPVEPYRERQNGGELDVTRERVAAWARSAALYIGAPWPTMPESITDRDADVWEALIAVADAAGGEWPSMARESAVAIVAESKDRPASLGIRLLADVRRVFETFPRLRATELLGRLIALDDAPWADLGGKGPVDARFLGRTFDSYGIQGAHALRFDSTIGVAKGWNRSEFADAWARYLPAEPTTLPTESNGATK